MQSIKYSVTMAWQVDDMCCCVPSLVCYVVQVNITRPYLCANHLAAPYTGLPASAAEAPSEAPPPQSASGAAGEGYGAGALILMLVVVHRKEAWAHSNLLLCRSASFVVFHSCT